MDVWIASDPDELLHEPDAMVRMGVLDPDELP